MGPFQIFGKTIHHLCDAVIGLLVSLLLFLAKEFVKFCLVLFLAYIIASAIFCTWSEPVNGSNRVQRYGQKNAMNNSRLSAGNLEGSFSKYPFIVEIPSKSYADSSSQSKGPSVLRRGGKSCFFEVPGDEERFFGLVPSDFLAATRLVSPKLRPFTLSFEALGAGGAAGVGCAVVPAGSIGSASRAGKACGLSFSSTTRSTACLALLVAVGTRDIVVKRFPAQAEMVLCKHDRSVMRPFNPPNIPVNKLSP
uniref:Uncharacterized protein n=1 Tax=Glossina austeni TaxID=7395 RepID=A0A1A9VPX1_GLOAU